MQRFKGEQHVLQSMWRTNQWGKLLPKLWQPGFWCFRFKLWVYGATRSTRLSRSFNGPTVVYATSVDGASN
jgi:hypothetical protein